MMVPEISLTPQAVERVAGRFPGRVAVLHSQLSPGERLDEWQRIRHGEADVVVGPRSALFAPLPQPGLIVVDEEHDASYKQDSMPRYNSRDAAAVLGRLERRDRRSSEARLQMSGPTTPRSPVGSNCYNCRIDRSGTPRVWRMVPRLRAPCRRSKWSTCVTS